MGGLAQTSRWPNLRRTLSRTNVSPSFEKALKMRYWTGGRLGRGSQSEFPL